MLMMRHLVIAGCAALALPAAAASAQTYYPVSGPVYIQEPGRSQPTYYNRVVVTQDPMPRDLGRRYPYMTGTQPGIVTVPSAYAPRPHHRVRRAARPTAKPMTKPANPPALVKELKQRPRIRSIAIEDTTGAIPSAPRHKAGKASRANAGERVIRAEAEVRIIGNDQMSIRLFRKRPAAAQASAD